MDTSDDRRAHPRVRTGGGPGWNVELHTYDGEGSRVDLRGTARSLSRTGVLVRTDRELEVGTGCLVHFREAGLAVTPAYALGRIARVDRADDAFDVAVHFERPLDRIPE